MEKIKLGDLCTPSQGQLKEKPDTVIDYIDISSVDNETKKVTGYQTMTFSESPSRARKAVKRGSILVSTVRPNLNAVAILENDTPNLSVASTGFCILDCKEDTDERFVFNYCKSKVFIDDMVSQATGASYPAVRDKIVRSALIPAYSYEKQRHIGIILDKVSDVIEKRRAELQALDKLIKARFVELFYDKGYPVLKWNDVFNTTTGKLDSNAAVEDGEYPFFTCSKETFRIDKFAFDQEALLLAGNNAAGKYDVKYYKGKFNAYQRTYVLGLKEDWSYQLFRYQLEDKLVYLQQQSLGGLTKYLTMKILGELDFIIPPMEKQIEFEEFAKQVDKSKVIVQKALDETQTLFDSLMQEYFG